MATNAGELAVSLSFVVPPEGRQQSLNVGEQNMAAVDLLSCLVGGFHLATSLNESSAGRES